MMADGSSFEMGEKYRKKSLIIISVLKIIPLLMIIISLVINVFMEGFLSTFITRPM